MKLTEISYLINKKHRSMSMYILPYCYQQLLQRITTEELNRIFFELLKTIEIKSLVECGANEASASRYASNLGIECLAIEANPNTFNELTPPCDKNFKKLNIGLGDKNSILVFYIPSDDQTSGSSTFKPKSDENYIKKKVKIKKLDDIIENTKYTNVPFSLWIDVEGMQKEVLMGAVSTLNNENCQMIKIEVEETNIFQGQHWHSGEIINFLDKFNYKPLYRDYEYSSGQYNILFLRANNKNLSIIDNFQDKYYNDRKPISIIDCASYLFRHRSFLNEIKMITIILIGEKLGNMLAALAGSRASKNYNKNE